MEQRIKVKDKEFEILFDSDYIERSVRNLAYEIYKDYKGKDEDVVFLAIMNGSFMFASDLLKFCKLDSRISFLKLASYEKTESGTMKSLIGVNEDLKGKSVIIIEDIVDSGNTIEHLYNELEKHQPKEIKVATMLFKPAAYKKEYKIDYVGLSSANDFVVGYGLDYDGFGRGYKQIYRLYEGK
jgi:hypoxanthine phosphoribosyltransferase